MYVNIYQCTDQGLQLAIYTYVPHAGTSAQVEM